MLPSQHKYFKAKNLVGSGQVILKDRSPDFFYFMVGDYDVRYARTDKGKTSCTCESGSIWGPDRACSHIEAVKKWIGDDSP